MHGAKGVTDDTILSAYYRHERAARIYDGADEVHKSRVARLILKKYSFYSLIGYFLSFACTVLNLQIFWNSFADFPNSSARILGHKSS